MYLSWMHARKRSGDDEDCYTAALNKDLIAAGDVGHKLNSFLFENVLRAGSKLVDGKGTTKEGRRLYLNSFGGCTASMFSIVDLFEEAWDLSTVATGACMSAAVPIIAAGTPGKRYATWRTRFMVHPVSTGELGSMESDSMRVELDEFEDTIDKYAAIMARYCNHAKSWWVKKMSNHAPWYFSARTAKEHGIIDHIIPDKIRSISR